MTVRAGHAVAVRNKIRVILKICKFVFGVVIGGIAITFSQDITILYWTDSAEGGLQLEL